MKLKAFSFLEVMVAIVISGMVISTVYTAYVFTYKQFFKYASIKAEIRDYFEFSQVFNTDFEQAKTITKMDEKEVKMQWLNKSVAYEFDENYILRTVDVHVDTFFLINSAIELNLVDPSKENGLIDYLRITVKEQSLSFYKNYGAQINMKE
ncbi:MAG: prepilin-type N-terminal cleavage/methylation domain-containing protein [Bacteroidetes bacterium]|nr:prepilin-type N-terminal cleavage/methylation domain-containing protein [Bacteroidota bacterium]